MSNRNLFEELKRRRVFRATAAYVVVAIGVAEVANNFFPALDLPPWTVTLVVALAILGLPVTIALSWAFDIRPGETRETPSMQPQSSRSAWTASRIAVVGAVAILALAGAAMLFTGRPGGADGAAVVKNRVAVLPFENRSGDPALDDFGIVAEELIADGLTAIDSVQSVSATEVRQVLAQAGDAAPLPWVARQTGAGMAVTGSYLLVGDSIQVRAQLVDPVAGTGLTSMGPARSARSDPTGALASIRQQAMGAIAIRIGENSEERLANLGHPPVYEAYRTFLVGLELFNSGRYSEAIREFDRARDADSTFWLPMVWAATAFGNLGRPALDDSVMHLVEPHRSELSSVERIWLDWHRAYLRGDLPAAYHAAHQGYE
ncbi:MAG: hypothetical protein P8Z36_15415, partial [Gemmatimonadota bacterium]